MKESSKKILIVEDDKLLLKLLSDKLRAGNFEPLSALTGEEGLKRAFAEHPALILLDIILVEMDGMGFLAELRKDSWGKDAPVIILTNLQDGLVINEAEEKGVRRGDYLIKSQHDLNSVLKKVQDRLAESRADK